MVITVDFASGLFSSQLVRRLGLHKPPVFTDTCSFRRPPAEWDVVYLTTSHALGRPNVFKLHGYYR